MSIDNERDLLGLLAAGKVVGATLQEMAASVEPGVTTGDLDQVAGRALKRHGARSAPQLFYGFPGVACISVNDEAVHGIPGQRVLRSGDLVKLDLTVELDGYVADAAITVPVGDASARKQKLIACAEEAFQRAMGATRTGRPIYEIGRAIESEVKRQGFTVLRELCSHGVGRKIHEEPTIPNYDDRRARRQLTEGLVITVEPIISAGSGHVVTAKDGWTEKTSDGSLSAHFEHTIVVTGERPLILTAA
ncbi:MAG: type I methionyl aminopeptidase [Chloroflexota bacterium]